MINKIVKMQSLLIAFCMSLCGCSNSDLLNFDKPAFEERYKEVSDALYIACKAPLLSSELYLYDFNYDDFRNPYTSSSMLEDTLIDVTTVHINNISNVYKAGYSDFNVKFCGIDISFNQKDSNDEESASFLLVLTDGMYNFAQTKKGFTDTRVDCNGVEEYVDTIEQMFEEDGEKANFKVDSYGENFDIEYLNEVFSEKCT